MTKKEKLSRALNHKSGPVPFDIGGTSVTSIHISMVEKLREYYGLEKRPIRLCDPLQILGVVDDDLKKEMGIDFTNVWNPNTIFGFKDRGEKEWRTPWGQDILVPEDFVTSTDEKGNVFLYAEGNQNYPPAGILPKGGYFFNTITRGVDFNEDDPHIEDNLEEFSEISEEDLRWIGQQADAAKKGEYAVVGAFGGTAIGDIAMVPGGMLKQPKGLRDVTEWYMATLTNQDYLHQIFTYQTDIAIKNLEKIYGVVGDTVQAAVICGTDFGTQKGPFCSKEVYRELYMPYYKKINNWIHSKTGWKTFKHSCGSILPLIPDIIESGFDILNPVQWNAENMNPKQLKQEFGKELVFWGGGVNTQKTFPFGKPEEVRIEVLKMCEIFSQEGGFVFNTIHNIQALTPIENLIALVDAVKEFNGRTVE